jgi:glycogen phosphorylase
MSQETMIDIGRRSTRVDALKRAVSEHVTYTLARDRSEATSRDVYMSTAWSVRDRLAERWAATQQGYRASDAKRVYYLSLEFLMGRTLHNALINLGIDGPMAEALEEFGHELDRIRQHEPDAGLGNGGLGRLAACYLDSMATLQIPGYGYGIRYEHGIFKQKIVDGRQVELPDNWLHDQNPWEIARPDREYPIKFYGRVEGRRDEVGRLYYAWIDTQDVLAMAYDTPVPGYRNGTVNTLRLWAAKATEEFDLSYFIRGDYIAAVQAKTQSETISKVLYPPDHTGSGKELRLKQQYFFVSATLQDIIRRYLSERKTFTDFPNKVQIQLNDTHPAVAIPELMRLLMDEHRLEWEEAWRIVTATCAYTNHTVLPEALETWTEELFGRLLPRQLNIVHEIDLRFREVVASAFPDDSAAAERLAIVSNGQVRMANLAIVGSHTVNGVAALHSQLIKEDLFREFHAIFPGRITSVTNGVTQRRWLLKANPALSELISSRIGDGWITDLEQLSGLEADASDAVFQEWWQAVKSDNKVLLARLIETETGARLNPNAMFDVQVKRIHEYKRQLLNVLHVADLYLRLRDEPDLDVVPRAVILGGKAAPTYWTAKLIIKLTNCLADAISRDRGVAEKLQLIFVPDFRVTLAERIYPGSDLSEQISTAGYEASGTGNMKFALNGALTIGTLDGANVEIADAVGRENIFIFGLTADEVARNRAVGYNPRAFYEANPRLQRVIGLLGSGELCPEEPGIFSPLIDSLLHSDPYMLLADFQPYVDKQAEVDRAYRDRNEWTRRAVLNVARCGFFSSDRSVGEYARRIWKL